MAEEAAQGAGAAHAVPLVAQAAGGEAERVAGAARLGDGLPGSGGEARAAVRRGEDSIFIEACAALCGPFRKRPVLWPLAVDQRPRQARDVQVAPARRLPVLVPDRLGPGLGAAGVVGEQAGAFRAQPGLQPAREFHRDRPVVPGLPRRRHGLPHPRNPALAVGDGARLFAPGGGGQQQVGVRAGGRRGERLLHHDELRAFQGATHRGLVGQALRRVGARDPERADFSVGGGLEHLHRRPARGGGYLGHAPERGHLGAVRGVRQVAVGGEQVGQPPHLPPPHGVGLAGERERARTGTPDLPAGQVQVDEGRVLVGAAAALVEALAVEAQRRGAGTAGGGFSLAQREPARGRGELHLGDAADLGHPRGRAVAHGGLECLEARGVRRDVAGIHPALPEHEVQHAVAEHDVGAGQDGQVQVGHRRRFGAARVGHDDLQARVRGPRVLDAPEEDGVRPGRVAARDEQALRQREVFIAGRRCVRAQRGLVARDGAAHAQAGIGVDVVGADQSLGQLVEDVVVLGEQLARHVEPDRIGAVRLDDVRELSGGHAQRGIPADGSRRLAALCAVQRREQAGLQGDGLRGGEVQRGSLGAEAAEIGGVGGVAAHAGDPAVGGFDDDAAAGAAVGAGGFCFFVHGGGLLVGWFPGQGCAPGGAPTFFCFAKRK